LGGTSRTSNNFDNSKKEDIEYLVMKIENGESFNKENKRALRHSALLLRLLKEVMQWNNDNDLETKKKELVKMLQTAAKRKDENKK